MAKAKKTEDEHRFDLGDVMVWTSEFMTEIVETSKSRFTRWDVMYIMLLTLEEEVTEFGSQNIPRHDMAWRAIIKAKEAVLALDVPRQWWPVGTSG